MIPWKPRALLMLVSAPSGAGKTTLCDRLLEAFPGILYSVSCTTRPPREGEVDGQDYHFLSADEFERRVRADEFLEHAMVYGFRYGTLRRYVEEALAGGRHLLLDLDVQGAASVRRYLAEPGREALRDVFVDVFIAPPSLEVLQARLEGRGKDAPEVIARRLDQARAEMAHWAEYRYLLVNDRLDAAYDRLRAIFLAEQLRVAR